jgi:uncharacterized protein (TIGR02145 family)
MKQPLKKGSFIDTRDGKEYKTIQIGKQTWMAENLAFEISGKEGAYDREWDNATSDKWCYYENNKEKYGEKFGILYQWKAAQEACPPGWHLPSVEEWCELLECLSRLNGIIPEENGQKDELARYLKTSSGWKNTGNGSDEVGFSAVPAGVRFCNGLFAHASLYGHWWTSSFHGASEYMWYIFMHYGINRVDRSNCCWRYGYSVRCVKSESLPSLI